MKRDRWTEQDVDALPSGEHDYFERKSGQLFQDTGEFLGALAKAVSAFANSGGGHILLGVCDDGTPDGVPPKRGNTSTRDWLEQQVPLLVNYPLSDFRVHVVERSLPSRIPAGREVIVIDVGDSALAPHQCDRNGSGTRRYTYYHRRAGRSEPAPHFYLELLRQRLISPVLEAELAECTPWGGMRVGDDAVFVASRTRFVARNVGRIAAYRWAVQVLKITGHPPDRGGDYRFHRVDFLPPTAMWSGEAAIRIDDTILPGGALDVEQYWGVYLRPANHTPQAVQAELDRMILSVTIGYRVATETSLTDVHHAAVRPVVHPSRVE